MTVIIMDYVIIPKESAFAMINSRVMLVKHKCVLIIAAMEMAHVQMVVAFVKMDS